MRLPERTLLFCNAVSSLEGITANDVIRKAMEYYMAAYRGVIYGDSDYYNSLTEALEALKELHKDKPDIDLIINQLAYSLTTQL